MLYMDRLKNMPKRQKRVCIDWKCKRLFCDLINKKAWIFTLLLLSCKLNIYLYNKQCDFFWLFFCSSICNFYYKNYKRILKLKSTSINSYIRFFLFCIYFWENIKFFLFSEMIVFICIFYLYIKILIMFACICIFVGVLMWVYIYIYIYIYI